MTFGFLTCILVHVKSDFQAKESHDETVLFSVKYSVISAASVYQAYTITELPVKLANFYRKAKTKFLLGLSGSHPSIYGVISQLDPT